MRTYQVPIYENVRAIYTMFTEDFLTKALWENLTVSLRRFLFQCSVLMLFVLRLMVTFFLLFNKGTFKCIVTSVFMIYNVAINMKICVFMYMPSFGYAYVKTCSIYGRPLTQECRPLLHQAIMVSVISALM